VRFERSFVVPLGNEAVWTLLWDVERIVACVPGCTAATVVEDKRRYTATIVEKVGPFKLEIPLEIEIGAIDVARSIRMRATGRDKRIGTEVTWNLVLELEPQGESTQCRITVDADVVGRLVSLGQGVIKLKGDQTLGRFADSLQASFATAPDSNPA
jgi:carbon monoxide dehydrogenase subunit G